MNPFDSKPTKAQSLIDNQYTPDSLVKQLDSISIKEVQSTHDDIVSYINKQRNMQEVCLTIGSESVLLYMTPVHKALLTELLDKKLVTGIKDVRSFGKPRGIV